MRAIRCCKVLGAAICVMGTLGGRATAQTTNPAMMTNPSLPAATDFEIYIEQKVDGTWTRMSKPEADLFFNRARCECEVPIGISVVVTQAGLAKSVTQGTWSVRVGPEGCLAPDAASRNAVNCKQLGAGPTELTAVWRQKSLRIETTVKKMFDPHGSGKGCDNNLEQKLWLDVDADLNGTPDFTGVPHGTMTLRGLGLLAPTGVTSTGGNEAIKVNWDSPTALSDFSGYLVFCARAGTYSVFEDVYFKQQYQTSSLRCPQGVAAPLTQGLVVAESVGAQVFPAPEHFRRLDKKYLCSDLLTAQTEIRVTGLQNGIPYVFGVSTVDTRGNASPIEQVVVGTPVPSRDFYRAYRADGGQAEGGFCALGGGRAAGRATWFIVFVALGLLSRRRRGG